MVTGVLDAAGDGVAGYFAGIKREEFFAYHSTVTPWEIDQYLTRLLKTLATERESSHVRDRRVASAQPRASIPGSGELLTGMLCEMADRGSDSAGVAVYGDPVWSPPGRSCVSLLDVDATTDAVTAAVATALGAQVAVSVLDDTYLVSADVNLGHSC